jgi:hypothetical protein
MYNRLIPCTTGWPLYITSWPVHITGRASPHHQLTISHHQLTIPHHQLTIPPPGDNSTHWSHRLNSPHYWLNSPHYWLNSPHYWLHSLRYSRSMTSTTYNTLPDFIKRTSITVSQKVHLSSAATIVIQAHDASPTIFCCSNSDHSRTRVISITNGHHRHTL